jgi:hypothetical protein
MEYICTRLQEMDAILAVQQCNVLTLSAHNLTQPFEAISAASIRTAAMAQDCIRWIKFMEGKISK